MPINTAAEDTSCCVHTAVAHVRVAFEYCIRECVLLGRAMVSYSTSFSKGPNPTDKKSLNPKTVDKIWKRSRTNGDQNPVEDQKYRSSQQFED